MGHGLEAIDINSFSEWPIYSVNSQHQALCTQGHHDMSKTTLVNTIF